MRRLFLAAAIATVLAAPLAAQTAGSNRAKPPESPLAKAAAALPLRSIGPSLMSGRLADIAVHPTAPGVWYVAAGSGGVWKTTNAGTTWTPVFEDQPSYSIGEITLDPTNPDVVWVGTGENVSGRHVGWGDGVYRSRDAGRTWQRMGLPRSEHIGRILVDPRDGNRVLVAAEGPLWAAGGERGVYRSTDGGSTWTPVLQIDENTGVTDLEFDPANPEVVYAAAYQRRRHVWGFLAGGPGSGLWKSGDNGQTWRPLKTGLPSGDMGKIGLAVTPADPSLVYATIEAGEEERGFYRSRDRGESWEKRNDYISGGTGPHYYQEIEASPLDAARVYQMDVFLHVTRDGGATMETLETGHDKHSDNHALWIDPANGNHFLVGTDTGLYESFDEGRTFRHFPNLPVAQIYKVALNNREPFYDVLAGVQDQGTLHGPSRTLNQDGIRNQDWYVPLGADGYGVAFDPRDPDLLYLMWQEGMLYRKDRRNDEGLMIRPQPAAGDPPERWNWDSPLLVSPHNPDRIYYGSQRVWQSDDRGGIWTPISGDLTEGRSRYEQKFLGRVWSVDALHDNSAMSKYATTTAISESPLREGTLAVGTDDGLVQVSTDGGGSWRRAAAIPGLPALSFVNDVEMSLHDAATLYVAADNHKTGDFTPYVFESTDLGRTWRSMAGDLPPGAIVWALQQDHVRSDLFFLGTERGLYVSLDRGTHWLELGGLPTIAFRDVKLHRRDNDLVGASFGRGIYVLDDYTPLRGLVAGAAALAAEGVLFPVRDAWWFVPYQPGQAPGRPELGSDDFTAPNPPHGALFTYFLREAPASARESRKAGEKALREKGADVPFPGFDRLRAEALEADAKVLLIVSDAAGRKVRWIEGPAKEGLHRVNWDLRGPIPDPVVLDPPAFRAPWDAPPVGPLVAPGRYSAELVVVSASGARSLGAPQSFEVKTVPNLPPGTDPAAVAAFQGETAEAGRRVASAAGEIDRVKDQLRQMRATLGETPRADPALYAGLDAVGKAAAELERRLHGDPARQELDEPDTPSIGDRVGAIRDGHWQTRQMPTATQRRDLEIATAGLDALERDLKALIAGDLAKLEEAFAAAGAPWTPGQLGRPGD
ncbi:MAG TPA: glycosyl hydrolase [Thermoanaerobaculia bacterium]|nr:glycosyl hydrolase [Thermoanaerobaculia bacterium]